tara:strand:+ start:1519 stop:1959 length:441 start_codon:yes stop_codon:yes gene_type:complete
MQAIEGGPRRTSVDQPYDHLATMVIIVQPLSRDVLRRQKARFRGYKPSVLRRRKRKERWLVPSGGEQMAGRGELDYPQMDYEWSHECYDCWDRVFGVRVELERYATECEEKLKKEENFIYHSNKKRTRRFAKDKQKQKKNRAHKRG